MLTRWNAIPISGHFFSTANKHSRCRYLAFVSFLNKRNILLDISQRSTTLIAANLHTCTNNCDQFNLGFYNCNRDRYLSFGISQHIGYASL